MNKNKIKKNPRRVRLLGKGKGWEQTPDNDDFELWGLNGLLYAQKKIDRLFMMDVLDEMPSVISGNWELPQLIKDINNLNIPLVAPYKYEEIPLSEAFPLEEAKREFGVPYFNNTIAYMIAYALLRGVEEIQLWGINQASGTEYFYEKGCVEYWLGVATGMGVRVSIHGKWSEILTNKARYGGDKLYGYNIPYEYVVKSKKKFGDVSVKKLLVPEKSTRTMFLGPEKSKGLRTSDMLGIKEVYRKFASHPEGRWTISLEDAYNVGRYVAETKPGRILDLGTGIGTSAAIAKLSNPKSEVVSVEQFQKCIDIAKELTEGIAIKHSGVEIFSLDQIPRISLVGYKDLPSGPWDMVIVDGPGDFLDKDGNLVANPIAGDIFRITGDLNKGAIVYVDGRKESQKLIHRYLSEFLNLVNSGDNFAVFKRNNVDFKPDLIKDNLLERLKQTNYLK